jgi:hypothetical protein
VSDDGERLAQSPMFSGEKPTATAYRTDTPDETAYVSDGEIRHATETQPLAAVDYAAFTVQAFPGGEPSPLVGGDDPQRRRVVVMNVGTETVVIGKRSQVAGGRGFFLPPNIPVVLEHGDAVFVITPTPGVAINPVSVMVETNR